MNKVLACALLLLAACGSDTGAPAGSGSAAKAASAPAKSSAPAQSAAPATSTSAGGADDHAPGKMSHCPAAVKNAKTEIKDSAKGVEITVTASDKADVEEIKSRAKLVSEHAKAAAGQKPHSGQGGGGGQMGRCPIVLNDTSVTVADVDGGSKFTIEPKDAAELEWLRRESKERLAAMQEPGAEDKGKRKMANCPSAVEGAKTTVKEDKGAVVVTVKGKDEAGTKAIRERATKLAATKHDGSAKGKHGGEGNGPGEGRCPCVLEGATMAAKDVDGGTEITLTPKNKADLKKLVEEAKDRAKPFE